MKIKALVFDAYGTFAIRALPVHSNVRLGTGGNRP
jgi:hypothetical protein